MFNFPSREDYDPYFFDPDGEIEAQQMREYLWENYDDSFIEDDYEDL
jgi:hypothetical protein